MHATVILCQAWPSMKIGSMLFTLHCVSGVCTYIKACLSHREIFTATYWFSYPLRIKQRNKLKYTDDIYFLASKDRALSMI